MFEIAMSHSATGSCRVAERRQLSGVEIDSGSIGRANSRRDAVSGCAIRSRWMVVSGAR